MRIALALLLLGLSGCGGLVSKAPLGPIGKDQAYLYAVGLAGLMEGQATFIAATGSMVPVMDENSVVVYMPSDGSNVRAGDVVLYTHPVMDINIIHRVAYVTGTHFIPDGIANKRNDGFIPRTAIYGRMVAIIYSDGQQP